MDDVLKSSNKTVKGELYKSSSLENFRHILNRYLAAPPFNLEIDMIKYVDFRTANESYRAALREIQTAGKGDTSHHPQIGLSDLKLIY